MEKDGGAEGADQATTRRHDRLELQLQINNVCQHKEIFMYCFTKDSENEKKSAHKGQDNDY